MLQVLLKKDYASRIDDWLDSFIDAMLKIADIKGSSSRMIYDLCPCYKLNITWSQT